MYYTNIGSCKKAVYKVNGSRVGGTKLSVYIGSPPKQKITEEMNAKKNEEKRAAKKEAIQAKKNAAKAKPVKKDTKKRRTKVCRLFARGTCLKGDECLFLHGTNGYSNEAMNKATVNVQVCRNYIAGGCNVDDCPFKHPKLVIGDTSVKSKKLDDGDNEKSVVKEAPKKKVKVQKVKPTLKPKKDIKEIAKVCAECDGPKVALTCESCEEVFCKSCDGIVHASKFMSKHTRVELPTKRENCQECEKTEIEIYCENCDASLCAQCSNQIHSMKVFKGHVRKNIDTIPRESVPNKSNVQPAAPVEPVAKSIAKKQPVQEKTKIVKASVAKVAASPVVKMSVKARSSSDSSSATSDDSDSDTSDDSDSDTSDESELDETVVKKLAAISRPAVKKSSTSSDDSSSDSSSDSEEEQPAKKKLKQDGFNTKTGISAGSKHTLVSQINEYSTGSDSSELHLSPSLNSFERLLAHDCAERLGLKHFSVGEGIDRHITISKN